MHCNHITQLKTQFQQLPPINRKILKFICATLILISIYSRYYTKIKFCFETQSVVKNSASAISANKQNVLEMFCTDLQRIYKIYTYQYVYKKLVKFKILYHNGKLTSSNSCSCAVHNFWFLPVNVLSLLCSLYSIIKI